MFLFRCVYVCVCVRYQNGKIDYAVDKTYVHWEPSRVVRLK